MPEQHATATAYPEPSPSETVSTATPVAPAMPTEPLPTPTVTASATASQPADHYWLRRPVAEGFQDHISPTYPYASRGDGTLPIHRGVEFVNAQGTPLLAVADGTIIVAGDDSHTVYGARNDYYGQLVVLELDAELAGSPVYVLYGHLSNILVPVGKHVETGEPIALVGMTGVAMGPHLHMEVRVGENSYGATRNPQLWLTPDDGCGTLAGRVLGADGEPVNEVRVVLVSPDEPDKMLRTVITYPEREVNPDPVWGETFCTGDLPVGRYLAQVYYRNRLYTEEVTVEAGSTAWLEIVAES